MASLTQNEINKGIELLMHRLSERGDQQTFEKTIQQNIDAKRLSATTEVDFYDRLMLNITYFVENKTAWEKILRELIQTEKTPTVTSLEAKALEQQMVIREKIARQIDDYTAIFHKQYQQLNVTTEDVIYDYAYASVEHSLRFDFLTFLLLQDNVQALFTGDTDETIRIINGYVAYYADQMVNQLELK